MRQTMQPKGELILLWWVLALVLTLAFAVPCLWVLWG
jgi:hypothetical protein